MMRPLARSSAIAAMRSLSSASPGPRLPLGVGGRRPLVMADRRVKSSVLTTRDRRGAIRRSRTGSAPSSLAGSKNAGWRASMPESITAQRTPWPPVSNTRMAASAFTVLREANTACSAGRLTEMRHSGATAATFAVSAASADPAARAASASCGAAWSSCRQAHSVSSTCRLACPMRRARPPGGKLSSSSPSRVRATYCAATLTSRPSAWPAGAAMPPKRVREAV
ncbi:hypothetical protein D3C81_1181920 [compost metagenome]